MTNQAIAAALLALAAYTAANTARAAPKRALAELPASGKQEVKS